MLYIKMLTVIILIEVEKGEWLLLLCFAVLFKKSFAMLSDFYNEES